MHAYLPLLASLPALVASGPSPRAFLQQRLAARLDLSPDQQARLQQVFMAHAPALQAKARVLKDARRGMVDGLLDPAASDEQVRAAQAGASAAAAELLVEAHQLVREIDPILTSGQKAQARRTLAELRLHLDGLRALALRD